MADESQARREDRGRVMSRAAHRPLDRLAIGQLALLSLALAALGCGRQPAQQGAARQTIAPQAAAEAPAEAGASRVRLFLNWYPEAEHGGFYAAWRQGYYREAGLDVEIVKGGPSAPVVQQVDQGQMEFGISNADGLLLARAQDARVVALMAPLQTSPRCIMVHAASGIRDFDDLKDLTIAMNPQPFASFLRQRLPLKGVTIVPYQGSVAAFLEDQAFAQQAYVFSEPFVARQKGGDPQSLLVADLGFNPYASVLFTSETYLADHGEVVAKMVAASVRGWRHYLDHPEETNRYLHEINPEMTLAALAFGVKSLRPLVLAGLADEDEIGAMSLARWQKLLGQLEELELLKPRSVEAERAFTTKYCN